MTSSVPSDSSDMRPTADWPQRLGKLRHDLRNPLGEILGFGEIIVEEAREQKHMALLPGLETVQRLANRMLAEVNRALSAQTQRLGPEAIDQLKGLLQQASSDVAKTTEALATHCAELGVAMFDDDLRRISGAATRLVVLAQQLDALGEPKPDASSSAAAQDSA